MDAAASDFIVAFAGVVGTVGSDAADLLVRRELVKQVPVGGKIRFMSGLNQIVSDTG